MGVVMSLRSQRSNLLICAFLTAGLVSLAAAGCASQGVTSGVAVPSGATGSQTAAIPASATSTPGSDQNSDSPSDSASSFLAPSDTDSSSAAPGKTYKMTDIVTDGGFKLKINSIQLPYNPPAASQFKPAETRAWLMLDFQVTNITAKPLMFDTIGGFDLRDKANASHLASIVPGDTLPPGKLFQDHEVKPGDTARGEVVFDVPQSGGPFRLLFVGNLWQSSQTPPGIMLTK